MPFRKRFLLVFAAVASLTAAYERVNTPALMSDALVAEYATNFPPMIADFRMGQFRKNQNDLYFAWMGTLTRGEGHYYLVRTPAFLIEYDNTQDGNNHIHSVWRDFNGDFGQDLLGGHYTAAHN